MMNERKLGEPVYLDSMPPGSYTVVIEDEVKVKIVNGEVSIVIGKVRIVEENPYVYYCGRGCAGKNSRECPEKATVDNVFVAKCDCCGVPSDCFRWEK